MYSNDCHWETRPLETSDQTDIVAFKVSIKVGGQCLTYAMAILYTSSIKGRYHSVLAPNHRWRGQVTPAKRGKGVKRIVNTEVG